MAPTSGFEPPTLRLRSDCSTLKSYAGKFASGKQPPAYYNDSGSGTAPQFYPVISVVVDLIVPFGVLGGRTVSVRFLSTCQAACRLCYNLFGAGSRESAPDHPPEWWKCYNYTTPAQNGASDGNRTRVISLGS